MRIYVCFSFVETAFSAKTFLSTIMQIRTTHNALIFNVLKHCKNSKSGAADPIEVGTLTKTTKSQISCFVEPEGIEPSSKQWVNSFSTCLFCDWFL